MFCGATNIESRCTWRWAEPRNSSTSWVRAAIVSSYSGAGTKSSAIINIIKATLEKSCVISILVMTRVSA